MGLVRRGMKGEGQSRQGSDPDGLGQVLSVPATRRGFLTTRTTGDGRDPQPAGCRRHSGTNLAQIRQAVG